MIITHAPTPRWPCRFLLARLWYVAESMPPPTASLPTLRPQHWWRFSIQPLLLLFLHQDLALKVLPCSAAGYRHCLHHRCQCLSTMIVGNASFPTAVFVKAKPNYDSYLTMAPSSPLLQKHQSPSTSPNPYCRISLGEGSAQSVFIITFWILIFYTTIHQWLIFLTICQWLILVCLDFGCLWVVVLVVDISQRRGWHWFCCCSAIQMVGSRPFCWQIFNIWMGSA